MSASSANLFHRMRVSRRAWLLVALALLVKLATATACLLDGPSFASAPADRGDATQLVLATPGDMPGDDACALGEGGGCHCACAHAMALPAAAFAVGSFTLLPAYVSQPPVTPSPRDAIAPLRPPIA